MDYRKFTLGFTLVELLVVIGMIGLLSAIILVNVNSARSKARRGAGISFASSMHNGVGDKIIRDIHFDDAAGLIATDSSSYGEDADLYNGVTWVSAASGNCIRNGCFVLDPGAVPGPLTSDWLQFINTSFFNLGFSERSVSVWFRALDTVSTQTIYDEGGNDHGFYIGLKNNELRFVTQNNGASGFKGIRLTYSFYRH